MLSWRLRSRSGQAAPEYVAVLAVLGMVFAGAGAVVAPPEFPKTLARHVRVALCVVGGDICRDADAKAAHLAPCDIGGESHARHDSITVGVRGGRGKAWSVQRLSDGKVLLTAATGYDAAAVVGAGVKLGPVDVEAGGSGGLAFHSGSVWELPNEAALARVLAAVEDPSELTSGRLRRQLDLPAPTYRFLDGGDFGSLGANADVKGVVGAGSVESRGSRVLGRRVGRGRTTWYLELGVALSAIVPEQAEGALSGRWVMEYEEGEPPVLTVRGTNDGPGEGRETETVASLVLSDPGDRAAARRFLALHLPVPPAAMPDALRLRRRLAESGAWQRFTYETTTDHDVQSASTALGIKLGYERETAASRRRLIDARLLGPEPRRRKDCLGV